MLLQLRGDSPRPLIWTSSICHFDPTYGSSKSQSEILRRAFITKASRTTIWIETPFPSIIGRLQDYLVESWKDAGTISTDPDIYHSDLKVTSAALRQFQTTSIFENQSEWEELKMFLDLKWFDIDLLFGNWIRGQNLALRNASEIISWNRFSFIVGVCLLFSANLHPWSDKSFNVVISEYLRQKIQQRTITYTEATIAIQSCLKHVRYTDALAAFSDLVGDLMDGRSTSQRRMPLIDFTVSTEALGIMTLSLTQILQDTETQTPSWHLERFRARHSFLLNHPRSKFKASAEQERPFRSSDGKFVNISGIRLDFVKATSQYLPRRHHGDHYFLGDLNIIIFSEWFDFAQEKKTQSVDCNDANAKLLLDYARTIQAHGCNSVWEPDLPEADEDTVEKTRAFLAFLEQEGSNETIDIRHFYARCLPSHNRRFGITRKGHLCLVPRGTERGDVVCVPHGSRVPYVFRKINDFYINIGECYIQGCMQGGVCLDGCSEQLFKLG
ncbi:hypothetical protein IQ07DRAFT_290682 [Pyrenochaeta sp. DS3sAY3a]|nr:hypothetical protein IQ07DRAFT_290682 [Pyrenochaeta sp. DS3sAY3a]